jgi:eukaryotic-like serine/threonine-protein kinase
MTPERWREVERIFQAALDREVSERSAFLAHACAGDAELRRGVESLLDAHRPDDRFLESGALNKAARTLAEEAARPARGQRLASYELMEPIGAGGMGEVWRALDLALGRHVAIKVLSSQYCRDPDRLRRFEQEARAAGMLNHPNVLAIYAVGKHEGSPYLVTELLEGGTVRQRLASGPVPEGRAIEYGDQIVQGLAAAHEKGIVHRDLKPENVFITSDGRVKILDFGLAKLTQSGPEHQALTQTASGIALGTPAYMSPEQVRGQSADHRSDIFAVGAVLYEMLAGKRPFLGETNAEVMTAILKQEPPPILGVSPQVDQIVRHCLEKEPAHRYQSARDLAFQLRLVRHPSSPTPAPLVTGTPRRRVASTIGGVVLLAATAALTWWLTRPAPPTPAPSFTRLTSDSGLTTDPAFSPDGKLVAYASDRGGGGNLDIWRQQLATGEAVRLTSDPADESEPTFSPDASRIAFRSERDGGGIYVVSAFGGEPRLVARHGRRPRFSPDGTRIAYWVATGTVWYVGQVFTISTTGGAPAPFQPEFASALYPIWSADGTKLLFNGARDQKDLPTDAMDWWLAPANGGPAVRTGALDILRRQRISYGRQQSSSLIAPADWIGDDVFFSGWSDESTNLWRISLSQETGKADDFAQKLTAGTSIEAKPSVLPGGRVAFASLTDAINIWSLPIAANSGQVTGGAQQVTSSAFDARTSVSADGKKLAFISTRLGNPDVWMKDLESGKETALTATPAREEEAEITADGTRISYTVSEGSRWTLYQIATTGGPPEQICDDCGRPWDWSPDGRRILYLIVEGLRQAHTALGLFDVATRQKSDYLVDPEFSVARARFSPDGRWISFMAFNAAGSHIVAVPFQSHAPPRKVQWVSITEHGPIAQDKPRWSPDGNLLYYTSEVDGFRCIWARRLDPETKRPLGQPLEVYHSHSVRRSLMNAGIPLFQELSVTADKLFFNLGETTGNIWMAEWKP